MNVTNVERIIAKIDNDFNPDSSDWIPRVGAWVTDGMNLLDVFNRVPVRKSMPVEEGIVNIGCNINANNIKVYDGKCEIKKLGTSGNSCGCASSTGSQSCGGGNSEKGTAAQLYNPNPYVVDPPEIINTINGIADRYNYIRPEDRRSCRGYVVLGNSQIQLNYNVECVDIETLEVEEEYSNLYGCNLPVIPNVGLLVEFLTDYCMYKMLTRGYTHPVMGLKGNEATNPYIRYRNNISAVKTAVIVSQQNANINSDAADGMLRSTFYISTFDPKNQ